MDRAAQIPGRELRLPADMQEVEQVELAGGEATMIGQILSRPPGVMAEAAAAGMAVAAQSDTASAPGRARCVGGGAGDQRRFHVDRAGLAVLMELGLVGNAEHRLERAEQGILANLASRRQEIDQPIAPAPIGFEDLQPVTLRQQHAFRDDQRTGNAGVEAAGQAEAQDGLGTLGDQAVDGDLRGRCPGPGNFEMGTVMAAFIGRLWRRSGLPSQDRLRRRPGAARRSSRTCCPQFPRRTSAALTYNRYFAAMNHLLPVLCCSDAGCLDAEIDEPGIAAHQAGIAPQRPGGE